MKGAACRNRPPLQCIPEDDGLLLVRRIVRGIGRSHPFTVTDGCGHGGFNCPGRLQAMALLVLFARNVVCGGAMGHMVRFMRGRFGGGLGFFSGFRGGGIFCLFRRRSLFGVCSGRCSRRRRGRVGHAVRRGGRCHRVGVGGERNRRAAGDDCSGKNCLNEFHCGLLHFG